MLSNEEIEKLFFWKRKLENVGRKGAILVLSKDNEDIQSSIAKYIPFFMKENRYVSLLVMSDNAERINKFQEFIDFSIEKEVVPLEYLDYIFRIENALGIFGRIYADVSIPLEDGDYYQLIGYDNITIEDIASYVIIQSDHIPSENEIEEGKEWTKRNSKYREAFDNVKSITSEYVRSVDEGLAIRQKDIIEDIIGDRNIYLYGDSKYAGTCIDVYRDCNIAGIIDRDISKVGITRKGVKIFGLDKIDSINEETDVVLISNRRYEEILMSLSSKGWKYNKDFFVLNPRPDIIDYNDIELETYIDEEISSGKQVYNHWRKIYPKEKFLLSPWNASGDIYVAGLYLNDYIEKKCSEGYHIFVTSKAAEKVATVIGYDAEIVSQDDMDNMLAFIRYKGFDETNSVNTNVNYPSKNRGQRVGEIFRILDFNTAHQRIAFQADNKNTKLKLNQENADEYFEKYDLKRGKTVLIAPYSTTLGNVPEDVSIRIVKELQIRGYSVCTNIAGDEKPIEGTTGLFLPYNIVLDFVNKAGGVIGIRSGLFDIISSSDAKMVVYYRKTHQSLFSLVHMGLKTDNIIEMNPEDDTWELIANKTVEFFE